MPRSIKLIAAAVGAAQVLVLSASAVSASGAAVPLPPVVHDRIGRAQIFTWKIDDPSVLIGKVDIIWGSKHAQNNKIYSMAYVPGNRDGVKGLAWFEKNAPTWVMQKCGTTQVAYEFNNTKYIPLDTANPAVRSYFIKNIAEPALEKTGFPALAVDNMGIENSFFQCPANGSGRYSGAKIDPNYAADTAAWLAALASAVHSNGKAIAANLYYPDRGADRFLAAAAPLDIVVDERGFTRQGHPIQLGQKWEDRIRLFQELAKVKAVVIIDRVDENEAKITQEALTWSIANYLLIKGDRTYIAMPSQETYNGSLVDRPIMHLPVGSPLEDAHPAGGVWVRRFEGVITVVNPTTSPQSFAPPQGWRSIAADDQGARGLLTLASGEALILAPVRGGGVRRR